jgi:hypothetical protein
MVERSEEKGNKFVLFFEIKIRPPHFPLLSKEGIRYF